MIAILRYLYLKSWRDRSLVALTLFTPGSWFVAMIVIRSVEMIRGRRIVDPEIGREWLAISAGGTAMMVAIATFWVLRLEIGDRSIGSLILAIRSPLIALSVTIYGFTVGIASMFLCVAELGIDVPREIGSFPNLLIRASCSYLLAAALGITMASISPAPAMVVPTWVLTSFIVVGTFEIENLSIFAAFLLLIPVFLATTSLILERRCAA